MKNHWIMFVIALTLISCTPSKIEGSQDLPAQEAHPVSTQEPIVTQSGNPFPTQVKNEMPDYASAPVQKFIDLAKDDLAKSLTIGTDQISVVNTMEITWPNSALGCPEPGKFYAQGQVPGYRIWLNAGNIEYDYHTDLNGHIVLCLNPDPDHDSSTGKEPTPEIGVPIK